jgi:hypothetical protein
VQKVTKRKNEQKMQGFRNYNLETMQREHCLDLMAPSYGKSISPPLSPNSGKSQRKIVGNESVNNQKVSSFFLKTSKCSSFSTGNLTSAQTPTQTRFCKLAAN